MGNAFTWQTNPPLGCVMVEPWSWRDDLARLQHLDSVIDSILVGTMTFSAAILAAYFLVREGASPNPPELSFLAVSGLVLSLATMRMLHRQELLRDYFKGQLKNANVPWTNPKPPGSTKSWMGYVRAWMILYIIQAALFATLLLLPWLPRT